MNPSKVGSSSYHKPLDGAMCHLLRTNLYLARGVQDGCFSFQCDGTIQTVLIHVGKFEGAALQFRLGWTLVEFCRSSFICRSKGVLKVHTDSLFAVRLGSSSLPYAHTTD